MPRSRKNLGQILVENGLLTKETVQAVMDSSRGTGKRLGESLVEAGACSEADIAAALAEQFDMEFVNLNDPEILSQIDRDLIPDDIMKKHLVLPLGNINGKLRLVISDPLDLELLDLLRFRLNTEIETILGARDDIRTLLAGAGSGDESAALSGDSLVTDSVDVTVDQSVDSSIDIASGEEAPIIRLVHRMITEAVRNRASDIHVEPMEDRVVLRYRIDGVCHVRDNLPKRMQSALLARLKLMAGTNIAERRIPQDGRIKFQVDDESIDFRVSACPAYHGESIVLRILRPESVKIGLQSLGFEADNLEEFNRIIRRPNGIFLVTGPTGSGKTTTLYSALDVLNRPDKKIITAEDPVEYSFTGINQCQVRENIGLTFASILRPMLRQAPNVILVGEIRDREVADIAIQAALTGHLVFSTLHTNDAPSAITRLLDMGVKPFLVASSIQAVLAQRLIRVLCDKCKQPDESPEEAPMKIIELTMEEAENGDMHRAVGCNTCAQTGFKGRLAIFEMMRMNSEIRDLAFNRASMDLVRDAAVRNGMRTLVSDGKRKVLRGVTTPQEVARFAQAESLLMENIDI